MYLRLFYFYVTNSSQIKSLHHNGIEQKQKKSFMPLFPFLWIFEYLQAIVSKLII